MSERVNCSPGIFIPRKTNMRVATVTKLKLSTPESKSYWYNVIEKLETPITKVSSQSSISFPPLSSVSSIKCSATDDNNVDYNLVVSNTQMRNVARELIVRVSPPSPSHNECARDINPQNLRHVEQINYLKDCDISNFQLDLLPEETSHVVEKNGRTPEKKIEHIKNGSKMYSTTLHNNPPPLNKLAQILKISSYVNEFLASTRLRIGSTVVPKKISLPVQTLNSHEDICETYQSFNQISYQINNEHCSLETRQFESIDRVEEDVECMESGELHEKHVDFQGIDVNSEDEECLKLQRPRAPSLGVASSVPSFGKILSSLENSDSTESSSVKDNSIDENKMIRVNNYSQLPRDFLKVPKSKVMMPTDSKNIRSFHGARFHWNVFNLHSKEDSVDLKSTSVEPPNVKFLMHKKKFKQWPKQSITHIIRALNHMKRRRRVTTDSNYEIPVALTHPTDSYAGYYTELRSELEDKKESSTNSTNSSTSSDRSDNEASMKNGISHENIRNLVSSTLEKTHMKANHSAVRTTMDLKAFETGDTVLAMRENDSATILNAMPKIKAMYARRKSDACLACLNTSMKTVSTVGKKISVLDRNIMSILPLKLQNVIFDSPNNFYDGEISSDPVDRSADVDIPASRCPDYRSTLSLRNGSKDDLHQTSEQHFSKINHADDIVRVSPLFSSDRKMEQSVEKKNIASSKSFVSTLSLTSERSKTASDQDDSDQAIDNTSAAGEGAVEQKSKFLAPCHAPLNLRPSFEPLKVLRGKKTRSIRSRVASLEKTTDHSCDEVSDDDGTPITMTKTTNEIKNGCPTSQSLDKISNVTSKRRSSVDESEYGNNWLILNERPTNTSYTQLKRASLILDDIYSQLNINKDIWDYNPSDSFRPISPIIPIAQIIKISQNSLKEEKNVIETLRILKNEYTKRISDKNFTYSESNTSNIIKIMKMTKRLLALLIESKLYLNAQYSLSHVDYPHKQKYSINSRQLRKVLPAKSYNLIAPILGLSQWHPKHWSAIKDARKLKTTARTVTAPVRDEKVRGLISKSELVTEFDLIVHPPSQRGSSLSEAFNKLHEMNRLNPYATFLIKPRRKAVIWRELSKKDLEGYDPEATLKNCAAKVTDKICSDFCQWLNSLGGFHTTVNEEILKNMFETDFTAEACKTMQISICEMPVVPAAVGAIRRCPQAGEVEILQKELRRDLKAEKKHRNSIGFGTNLPRTVRFVPPKNDVENNWFRCENVPEELKTVNSIRKGIIHLDSIKGFTEWLERNPNGTLPVAPRNASYTEKITGDTS